MRSVRLFVDSPLRQGGAVELDDALTNKVSRTLRLKPGARLLLFNGDGLEHDAVLSDVGRHRCTAEVTNSRVRDCESPVRICLAQGLARSDKMDLALQKAVELGVTRFVPIVAQRSVVKLSDSRAQRRQEHWRGIAIAACEQSGRNRVPDIEQPMSIREFLAADRGGAKYVLTANGDPAVLSRLPGARAVAVLIGPEGGLTQAEQDTARAAGFKALRLGPRVLRTETAAIAALTLFQYWWGDLGAG